MAKIINFDIDYKECLKKSAEFLGNKDYKASIQYLRQAQNIASDEREKSGIYLYFNSVLCKDNEPSTTNALLTESFNNTKSNAYIFYDFPQYYGIKENKSVLTQKNSFFTMPIMQYISNIYERNYSELDDFCLELVESGFCLDKLSEAFISAVECDHSFSPLFCLRTINLVITELGNKAPLIESLLKIEDEAFLFGYMCNALPEILLDTVEDSISLANIGEVYLLYKFGEEAKNFFTKCLELAPTCEKALYYMAMIENFERDSEKCEDYLNKLNLYHESSKVFVKGYKEFFKSEEGLDLVKYPYIPTKTIDKVTKKLLIEYQTNGLTDVLINDIVGYSSLIDDADAEIMFDLLDKLSSQDLVVVAKLIMKNYRSNSGVKFFCLVRYLDYLEDGYLIFADVDKYVQCEVKKFRGRVKKNWKIVYKNIILDAFLKENNFPLDCKLLTNLIKSASLDMPDLNDDDIAYAVDFIKALYIKCDKLNFGLDSLSQTDDDEDYFNFLSNFLPTIKKYISAEKFLEEEEIINEGKKYV